MNVGRTSESVRPIRPVVSPVPIFSRCWISWARRMPADPSSIVYTLAALTKPDACLGWVSTRDMAFFLLFLRGGDALLLKGMRSSAVGGMAMYERVVNAWITLFFVRMKYFFAWKVS